MHDRNLTPYQKKRTMLGIPKALEVCTIIHVKAYRGVCDDLLIDYSRQLSLLGTSPAEVCEKEKNTSRVCIINLSTESLPDDFLSILENRLLEDTSRRTVDLQTGRSQLLLSGLGIWLTVMPPVDDAGLVLNDFKGRSPFGPGDNVTMVNRSKPASTRGLLDDFRGNFEMFVRDGEVQQKIPYFLRVIAGQDWHEASLPGVRKRVLTTLEI